MLENANEGVHATTKPVEYINDPQNTTLPQDSAHGNIGDAFIPLASGAVSLTGTRLSAQSPTV